VRTIIILNMLKTITVLICCALPSSAVLAACDSQDDTSSGTTVVATTGVLADIAEHVVGPDVEVKQLVPTGGSPHDFQLSAQGRQELEEADLVVADGADLEATIPLDQTDAPIWQLADHVGPLLPFSAPSNVAGASGTEEEEPHGPDDPHVWMDAHRVAHAMPSLGAALSGVDPDGATGYRDRARRFAATLDAVDRRVVATLRPLAPAARQLVTSHDALRYFADRYDFRVVATAFPASGPEAEASASDLAEVEDAIRATGVATVFAGEEDDPEALQIVASDTGVTVEDGLYVESPGPEAGYPKMLVRDARLIAAGLKG
jgi:ABC-type Zn uptake system ZnuABC Zn-binding protein ZnuA